MLGTGTINMPNGHPAAIAAQVSMLDNISKGRFIMGISPGGLMSDAEVFGNYQKNRNAIFLESINMVLKIWESEGPHGSCRASSSRCPRPSRTWRCRRSRQGALITPSLSAPASAHRPGTAVAPFSQGVAEMAKRGWSPISANFLQPEWVKTHWPKYVEGRDGRGGEGRETGGVAGGQVDLRGRRRGDGAARCRQGL